MSTVYWIVEYGATFTELFLCSIFCGTFIENTDLKKNFWKRFFVAAAISFVILIYNNKLALYSPITVILSIFLYCLSQIIVYFKNPIKASILSIVFLLILSISDNIIVSTISYVLKIPTSEIYEKMSLYRIIAIICSKMLLMFMIVTINKFFAKKILFSRKYLIILFTSTISMLFLGSLITFLDLKNNAVNSYVSIMFFVVMLILLIVIFFGTFKLSEYYENKQQFKLVMLRQHRIYPNMRIAI